MSEAHTASPGNEIEEKRTWEAPTIEELDFSATEASYMPGAPVDLGTYTF